MLRRGGNIEAIVSEKTIANECFSLGHVPAEVEIWGVVCFSRKERQENKYPIHLVLMDTVSRARLAKDPSN